MPPSVESLGRAYRQGLEAPLLDFSPGREGQQLLLCFAAVLGLDELISIKRGGKLRSQALMEARQGNLDSAAEMLRDCVETDLSTLSPRALEVSRSLNEPAWAYLDYRRSDFAEAQRRLLAGLHATETLQADHGLDRLEGRRIHLARNLARVLRVAGEPEKAGRILRKLLTYLAGDAAAWPLPTPRAPTGGVNAEDAPLLAGQITGELALLFSEIDQPSARPLVYGSLHGVDQAEAGWATRVARWLRAKAHLLGGDPSRCLDHLPEVLMAGRGPMALLWHSAVVDLDRACHRDPRRETHQLRTEIAEDCRRFPYLPDTLRVAVPSRRPAEREETVGFAGD